MNIFHWYRLLSLDVVGGVAAGAILSLRVTQATPPGGWWILLLLSVWVIYLLDHWYDKNIIREAETFAKLPLEISVLKTLVVIASLTLFFFVLFFYSRSLLFFGSILGVCTSAYLFFRFFQGGKRIRMKEPVIAFLYTAGIWGYPVWCSNPSEKSTLCAIFAYFLIVLCNVLIFSLFQFEKDCRTRQYSFCVRYGKQATRLFAAICLFTSIPFLIFGFLSGQHQLEFFILSIMAGIYSFILIFSLWFSISDRYTWFVDHVLCLPFLLLLKF